MASFFFLRNTSFFIHLPLDTSVSLLYNATQLNIKADALSRFGSLSDVRVIAPKKPQEWLAARAQMPCIRVFCGEFSRSCPAEDAEGMTVVTGAAEYIHEWPRLAFADCR